MKTIRRVRKNRSPRRPARRTYRKNPYGFPIAALVIAGMSVLSTAIGVAGKGKQAKKQREFEQQQALFAAQEEQKKRTLLYVLGGAAILGTLGMVALTVSRKRA